MKGKCRFGKLQLFLQPNRVYLSKKPLFFRRKEDEKFKEKNPFGQVPITETFFISLNLKHQFSYRLLQITVFQLKTANLFTSGIAEYSLGKIVFAGLKK